MSLFTEKLKFSNKGDFFFYKFCKKGGTNLVSYFKLQGKIPIEILEKALALKQKMHYHLNVAVEECIEPKFSPQQNPIPVRHIKQAYEGQAEQEVINEIHTPFNLKEAPLVRAVLIDDGLDSCDVIFTISHLIADGTSVLTFCGGVLKICGKLLDNNLDNDITPFPILYPEQLFPQSDCEKVAIDLSSVKTVVDTRDFPFDSRRTNFVRFRLTEQETKNVILNCRENNTTVHGALYAAFALTLRDNIFSTEGNTEPFVLNCDSPFSVRKYCNPPVPDEQMGNWIGTTMFPIIMKKNVGFWDLARQIKEIISDKIEENYWNPCATKRDTDASNLINRMQQKAPYLNISNMKEIDSMLPREIGSIRIDEAYFHLGAFTLLAGRWAYYVWAYTYNNRLSFILHFTEPFSSRKEVESFGLSCIQNLIG